jgi:preprotein translocase subunit SecG
LASWLLLLILLQPQQGTKAMAHTHSGSNQNQIQKSLIPMIRTWAHSIGWTVLLSALLAILFALAVDGCAALR